MLGWEPLPEDVKALIPARVAGREFTSTSTPTSDQVETLIADMARDLRNYAGTDILPALQDFARDTAAWGAAAEVERGLYPEQSTSAGSNYSILRAEYLDRRARLAAIAAATGDGGGTIAGVPDPGTPSGVFPEEVLMPWGEPVTAHWAKPGKDYYRPISSLGF